MAEELTPKEIRELRPKPLECGVCEEPAGVCRLTELDKAYCWARKTAKAQIAKSQEVCPECGGNGYARKSNGGVTFRIDRPCPTCQGTGKVSYSGRGSDGFEKCPICGGEGKLLQYDDGKSEEMGCDYCQGTGKKHRLDSSDREKELNNILDSYDEHWKQFICGERLHPSYSETRKQIIALIKGGNDG
ncbi:hypothetical protein LCGC14_1028670 [marine sediment metagenome]|uniref:CR-type domain-containing protein n=1 Tax=marine sediment metagenome TaxID=412755 RepID=A0A0F9MZR1_9ZZZZ